VSRYSAKRRDHPRPCPCRPIPVYRTRLSHDDRHGEQRDVLPAATVHSAAALGLQGSIGQIHPVYAADLAGLRGHPGEDGGTLVDASWIISEGGIVEDKR